MSEVNEKMLAATQEPDRDTPVLGGFDAHAAKKLRAKDGVVVRYYTGTITNPDDALMLEDLMSRSYASGGALKEVGDVLVITEQGTFDKEGCYHVVVKYMEKIEKPTSKV